MLKKAAVTLALLGLLTPNAVKAGDLKTRVKELVSQTVGYTDLGLGFTSVKQDKALGSIGTGFYVPVGNSHFLTAHAGVTVFQTKEVGGEAKIGVAQIFNVSNINFLTEFNAGYTGKIGWNFGLRSYVGNSLYLEFSRSLDEDGYLVKFGVVF